MNLSHTTGEAWGHGICLEKPSSVKIETNLNEPNPTNAIYPLLLLSLLSHRCNDPLNKIQSWVGDKHSLNWRND